MATALDIQLRFRSLLQKAVRRGHTDLVLTVSALIESLGPRQRNWFRSRAGIITFEECWPLGGKLRFTPRFYSKAAALVQVSRSVKAKDASGLGYLAWALARNDNSVLDGSPEDRTVKIVARAITHPHRFRQWLEKKTLPPASGELVENAFRFLRSGRPVDTAIVTAAACLAADRPPPAVKDAREPDKPFPYWVALDRHTPEGRRVLRDIARDLHIPLPLLEWCGFYFEGAATNAALPSPWWQRYSRWYFGKVGLAPEEVHLLWEPVRSQLKQDLSEDARQLHREIYSWKMKHRNQLETLKSQVELFIRHYDELTGSQLKIF